MSHTLGKSVAACGALAATMVVLVGIATNLRGAGSDQMRNGERHPWKASELIGQSVYTADDQEKGKIKDLMIGPDGRVEYAAVSFGGFLGIGDKLFAVPLDAIHLEWKDNKLYRARVNITEETIKQRQGFEDSRWPEQPDRGFLTSR
jgi:sporulation protein YlmC with PRC-barrel domain